MLLLGLSLLRSRLMEICKATSLHSALMSSSVSVRVTPSLRTLFDEPVCISVVGLHPQQEVSLRASLTDETGVRFQSRARYRAGPGGELDLTRSPSLGGSFTGIEPMGLFWALEPHTPHRRLLKKDVQTPFRLELEVHEGHGDPPGELLVRGTHERGFMREGMLRIPVREGRLRATLFQPPGRGPFPGIIDLYGTGGGLPEYRASLLASHGFATLALAYYSFEDLPKQMKAFDLEYFEEAINYMLQHPQVRGPGVGLLGHSKGGDLVLSMAAFLKGITATATINGSIAAVGAKLTYKDIILQPLGIDPTRLQMKGPGLANIVECLDNPLEGEGRKSLIPIEKAECKFLFIVGADDKNWRSEFMANAGATILTQHGKEKPEIVIYPGAGHYIEPPFFPMCPSSMHFLVGMPCVFGGEPKAHALAQDDAWQKIQNFFQKHLSDNRGLSSKF